MASKPDLAAARAFQDDLRKAMDGIPPMQVSPSLDHIGKRTLAHRALKALIEGQGGVVRETWNSTSVQIFGLRATSTSGLVQACQNWITQLTLKSMAGGA